MTAEQLALFVASLVAPFLIQYLKKWFGNLEAVNALWVAFGTSVVLGGLALFLTGGLGLACDLSDPLHCVAGAIEAVGVVFGLATVIYKFFLAQPK